MELRQLEHFVTAADFGSTNRAAEALYTSQPNVSKVIASLEKDLGVTLFLRTHRGLQLTPQGRKLYHYAHTILKNAEVMQCLAREEAGAAFRVSVYPSHSLLRVFRQFYTSREQTRELGLHQGTTEEIAQQVASGLSEIGVLYIAESQRHCFDHVLGHLRLKFSPLAKKPACIYVGRHSPAYGRKSLSFAELQGLKFVVPAKDFFSVEHHLDWISLGAVAIENLHCAVETNSPRLVEDLLLHTDLCCLGIRFTTSESDQLDFQALEIQDCQNCLVLGYVHRRDQKLSSEARDFLGHLERAL